MQGHWSLQLLILLSFHPPYTFSSCLILQLVHVLLSFPLLFHFLRYFQTSPNTCPLSILNSYSHSPFQKMRLHHWSPLTLAIRKWIGPFIRWRWNWLKKMCFKPTSVKERKGGAEETQTKKRVRLTKDGHETDPAHLRWNFKSHSWMMVHQASFCVPYNCF